MNAKKFSDAMSELDTKYVDEALNYKKKAKKHIWVKWGAIAACVCLMIPLTAFAVDIIQYNAAVDYLNSLGIAVEDLSDYSHKEIKEAAKTIDAGESNPLTEEILSLIPENKEPLDTPTQVTSEQIKELTPTMTREDVLSLLGDTQDVGSGIYIYLYEVDQQYLLRIPFASDEAQLGVTGEDMFLSTVRKYTRAKKLTPRMVNELIDHIEVYQAEKIDGEWVQKLTIHYNCIGALFIPDTDSLPVPDVTVNTRRGVYVSYEPAQNGQQK